MQNLTLSPIAVKQDQDSDRSKAIQTLASRMAARHSHLASMADKAAAIVERGGVARRSRVQAEVTGDSGGVYDVQLDADGRVIGCTCPAFYYRPAVVNGRHFCKHIVAFLIDAQVGSN